MKCKVGVVKGAVLLLIRCVIWSVSSDQVLCSGAISEKITSTSPDLYMRHSKRIWPQLGFRAC
jgi:hypothetical protein